MKTSAGPAAGKKKTSRKKKPSPVISNDLPTEIKIGTRSVLLTHLSKIYFPKEKITKGDIIAYYQTIAGYILPYMQDRPQSLYRHPNGIAAPGFYHKNAGEGAPDWVQSKKIYSKSNQGNIDYIICNNAATLAYLNNLGCIELNTWHSRLKTLDKPDYLAIDLDPSPQNIFEEVIETALAVKEVLDKAGAKSYCKTSGGTGLHIYVPLGGQYDYDAARDFAHIVAMMTSELVPAFTSLTRSLKQRGNKLYVDFLQNSKGQTLASAYSCRPRPGATVSTPLQWKEVKKGLHPSQFTIFNIMNRLKKVGDLFNGILGKGIDLRKCIRELEK